MGSFIERTYFSYIPSREERGRQQAARAPGLRAEGVGFSLCVWAWLDLAFGFFRPGGRGPAETPAVRWMGRGGGRGVLRLAPGSLLSLVSEDPCLDPGNMARSRS